MEKEFSYLFTPLVIISGLNNTAEVEQPKHIFPTDTIELTAHTVEYEVAEKIRKKLAAKSRKPAVWHMPGEERNLYLRFCNTKQIYSRRQRPSILSPQCEGGPLYPNKLFTPEWLKKYLFYLPSTIMVWFDVKKGYSEDDLVTHILNLKQLLAPHGINLLVILIGSEQDLTASVPNIRRSTGLPARTGLLAVAEDYSPIEIDTFVDSIWQLLENQAAEFFALRLREVRRKRNSVDSKLDFLLCDARYTTKMGCFAEFRGDYASALKLYESAYDSILLLFDNEDWGKAGQAANKTDSENQSVASDNDVEKVEEIKNTSGDDYINARQILDVVALKILQMALSVGDEPLALRKFNVHILSVDHYIRKVGFMPSNIWKSAQYIGLSETLSHFPDAHPGSAGMYYLEAATVSQTKSDEDSNLKKDPYQIHEDTTRSAFLNAISNLVGLPSCRGYALVKYGDWIKSLGDSDAALESYKSAYKSFAEPKWPSIEEYLAKKLDNAGFADATAALWQLGKTSELKSAPQTPLFKVEGTFNSKRAYIGRSISYQITLTPLFANVLTIDLLKVRFSDRQVDIKHNQDKPASELEILESEHEVGSKRDIFIANLTFSDNKPRVLELHLSAGVPGDLSMESVEVCRSTAEPEFSQSLKLEPSSKWIKGLPVSPRTTRHLKLTDPLRTSIETRPAQIEIIPRTEAIAAPGEKLPYKFDIVNKEDEKLTLHVEIDDAHNYKNTQDVEVDKGASVHISGVFEVPQVIFNLTLSATYMTSADSLPVKKEYSIPVEVLRPFRVNFDLLPEFDTKFEWPNFFISTDDKEEFGCFPRSWRLAASILALPRTAEKFIISSSLLRVSADQAEVKSNTNELPGPGSEKPLAHNDMCKEVHSFTVHPGRDDSGHPPRSVEAQAEILIKWARSSSPDIINEFLVPPVRLSLPSYEPRVLAVTDSSSKEWPVVHFWVENCTSRCLNFAVSMASSPYFAFQGPKALTIRLLPYTRRRFTYKLCPLGDPFMRGLRPLPEFRAFDTNYKRALAVLPGDPHVVLDQGTLFV